MLCGRQWQSLGWQSPRTQSSYVYFLVPYSMTTCVPVSWQWDHVTLQNFWSSYTSSRQSEIFTGAHGTMVYANFKEYRHMVVIGKTLFQYLCSIYLPKLSKLVYFVYHFSRTLTDLWCRAYSTSSACPKIGQDHNYRQIQ